MIHALQEILHTKIKAEFSAFKKISYYKGEFEEGTDWNPAFPVVFTNCSRITPGRYSTHKALIGDMTINIYVGIKVEDEAQTTLFENLILYLNNLNEDTGLNQTYMFELKPITLIGYFYNIEAYLIEIAVNKKLV